MIRIDTLLSKYNLQDMDESFSETYVAFNNALAGLESYLVQFGYVKDHGMFPPDNPHSLTEANISNATPKPGSSSSPKSTSSTDLKTGLLDIPQSFEKYESIAKDSSKKLDSRSPSVTSPIEERYRFSLATAEALAPMTAAKLRKKGKMDESPSSISSIGSLSPSVASLLGKYAGTGKGKSPSKSPLPLLSPAFATAEKQQKEKMRVKSPLPSLEGQMKLRDHENRNYSVQHACQVAPNSHQNARSKPTVVMKDLYSNAGGSSMDKLSTDCWNDYHDWQSPNEESTMELKAQIIFNSGAQSERNAMEVQQNVTQAVSTAAESPYCPQLDSSNTDRGSGPSLGSARYYRSSNSKADMLMASSGGGFIGHLHESQKVDDLKEAISAALGQPSSFLRDNQNGRKTLSETPGANSSSGASRTYGKGSFVLTPSLPTVIPPFSPIEAVEYMILPKFIRGQLSLESLNEASAAVHTAAQRKFKSESTVYFSMDDVEQVATPIISSSRIRVLLNALAKLDRVQVKVVYGQGTVYFFNE